METFLKNGYCVPRTLEECDLVGVSHILNKKACIFYSEEENDIMQTCYLDNDEMKEIPVLRFVELIDEAGLSHLFRPDTT